MAAPEKCFRNTGTDNQKYKENAMDVVKM